MDPRNHCTNYQNKPRGGLNKFDKQKWEICILTIIDNNNGNRQSNSNDLSKDFNRVVCNRLGTILIYIFLS